MTAENTVEMRRYNKKFVLGGKQNDDGSFSVRFPASQLVEIAFVDFYDERKGTGYQRNEPQRDRRGREIAEYIARCKESGTPPRLFELTANARMQHEEDPNSEGVANFQFRALDETGTVGSLTLRARGFHWLSIIDGGTRLRGIEMAIEDGTMDASHPVDVRLYVGHSVAEEIALFLLVNEKQKKVRTDLSARVVQRQLDEGDLNEDELAILQTVVPDTEQWRYEAVRIASRLNNDRNSPWRKLIQMPGERESRPIKLQAFWTSLRGLLTDEELNDILMELENSGNLRVSEGDKRVGRTQFITQTLKNFWNAVAQVNPPAYEEPFSTVLFGAVGVTASHIALVPVLISILSREESPDLSQERFVTMLDGTTVVDYDFWFTRAGEMYESYPERKGEATHFIGASGYVRLAKQLEKEWRRNLGIRASSGPVKV